MNSSPVEALLKEINYRVKGTEKYWNRPEGAESTLQIRAALLSNANRLATHMKKRLGCSIRRYQKKKAGETE